MLSVIQEVTQQALELAKNSGWGIGAGLVNSLSTVPLEAVVLLLADVGNREMGGVQIPDGPLRGIRRGLSLEVLALREHQLGLGPAAAVRNDPDITRLLNRTEIDQLFDITHALRHTETIIERALSNSSKT